MDTNKEIEYEVIEAIDNVKEKSIVTYNNINAITGDRDYLYNRLKTSFEKAEKIDIIVSFLMESGVKLILNDLREAIKRGVKIRILTGNYLGITQPWALRLIKNEFGEDVDLRFYNVKNKSFHPKAYMFHKKDDSEIYVGSSNISYGALTNSIEWNYRFSKNDNQNDFNHFYRTFEDLFYNHSQIIDDEVLEEYSKNWKRPNVYKQIEENENGVIQIFTPKGAQIEALHCLDNTRDEGFDKGLIVAATGIGKTYLAAFDSKEYKRVLFIAHREEIIKQAAQSFKNVRDNEEVGFFYGANKDNDKNLIFALVQTLGKADNLNENNFPKDYFDYIVVDEFHHAVSDNYKRIIEYFTPKFLLGLTATPERLDAQDVFAICDYNLVYEVRLNDAINKGWLVPFRYYGIYDDTVNYEEVNKKNGKYALDDLEEKLKINNRAELILKHYRKYNSKRAMGFCTSRGHAEFMAKYFSDNGVMAVAVYSGESGEYSEEREKAINGLNKGEIQVIFSVDMFNEGVDIPGVDMVMFLRPTESPTVFLQQLGRGLRKYKNKEYLNVLDFIGNYKKADLIPFLLSGRTYKKLDSKRSEPKDFEYPEDCIVDFDFRLVDIFKKLAEKEMGIKEKLLEQFLDIKEELGHRPSRVELFTYMDSEVYEGVKSKGKLNPFKNYLEFLKDNGELTQSEEELYNSRGRDFINMIECTAMSKTYKMPVLLAFYNDGNVKMGVNEEDIYRSFYDFYHKGSNKVDLLKDKSGSNFESWDKNDYVKLAKNNPIKYLLKSEGNCFTSNVSHVISLASDLEEFIGLEAFVDHMKDGIDFRVAEYYRNRFNLKHGE